VKLAKPGYRAKSAQQPSSIYKYYVAYSLAMQEIDEKANAGGR
jgi:hypothetical protein